MPLIVGIDPGTTTGIALMDLDGNLILLKSRKNLSKAGINRFIVDFGNPVILGSDKFPTPRLIEKTAATFSARMVVPREPFPRTEKERIIHDFSKRNSFCSKRTWKNQHEKDALTAALFAWNRVGALINRVDKKLEMYKGMRDYKRLSGLVKTKVLLEGENIDSCIKSVLER